MRFGLPSLSTYETVFLVTVSSAERSAELENFHIGSWIGNVGQVKWIVW